MSFIPEAIEEFCVTLMRHIPTLNLFAIKMKALRIHSNEILVHLPLES